MDNKFDQLAKTMAQSVTRRQALGRFGLGLAGMALAAIGLPSKAKAYKCVPNGEPCGPDGGVGHCIECCSCNYECADGDRGCVCIA
jgi:hypothetical protein